MSAKITQLGYQVDALSQQYDQATAELQTAQQKVGAATAEVTKANAATAHAKQVLKQRAIQDYVQGGNFSASAGSLSNATTNMLAHEYMDSLASQQRDAVDQYHQAAVQDEAARQRLQAQQRAVLAKVHQLDHDKQAGLAAEAQLQAALNKDKGQIATLIAQQQAAQRAAELAAAQARIRTQQTWEAAASQQQAAQAQRSRVVTAAGPSTQAAPAAPSPVPVQTAAAGRGAAGAVSAALSRVGAPYVFGGSGPWGFDCSGLVMWAYAQVGISLPHNSAAQYSATTHISMSALQPGDIVWVANVGQHEAMYIGGGQIVEAQHTGTNVLVTPLRSEFVLAGRVG